MPHSTIASRGETVGAATVHVSPGTQLAGHFRVVKRTPATIHLPGGASAGELTTTSSHLDIARTVLDLLGIDDGSAVMRGRDVNRGGQPLAVFRDDSFDDESHYVANQFGRTVASRCYEPATAEAIDCEVLAPLQREARERLAFSDTIVQGNLIPTLATESATVTR